MTKLKTLKDLKPSYGLVCEKRYSKNYIEEHTHYSVKDLKQMAIEWVKHLVKINKEETNEWYSFAQVSCIDLLKEIFNLTEQDLKEEKDDV